MARPARLADDGVMTAPLLVAALGPVDWAVLGGYLVAVIAVGFFVSRRRAGGDDFFLASRSMPGWAVAVSVLATSQSAATFVGGPQQAYAGDLTYLAANLGALVAVVVVAVLFLPAYYREGVTSVYELIGRRCGRRAQVAASAMFLLGRVFASGARLFIVALPFALITFGDVKPGSLVTAILVISVAAAAYTMAGGIRAVIWTDVMQAVVYIATIVLALAWLWNRLDVGPVELVTALRDAGEGDKLRVIDLGTSDAGFFARPYSIWAILTGLALFNLAAFGTDQDLTQRMLTCRSARSAGWSVIMSNVIGWPVVLLFLLMGLLLYVYYQRPELAGIVGPEYVVDDSRKVFLEFILHEVPVGLRGLMLAGLFAAAMSSTDSALNAMSSATIADFDRPWRQRRGLPVDDRRELRVSRIAILVWTAALAGFAIACIVLQKQSGQTLIDFALGVMVYAYAGLLAVFLTLLLTKRGSGPSVIAALVVGFAAVLAMNMIDFGVALAFPWKMVIATAIATGVCMLSPAATERVERRAVEQ